MRGQTPEGVAGRAGLSLSGATAPGTLVSGRPSGHSQDQLSPEAVGISNPFSNAMEEFILGSEEPSCLM